MDFGNNTFHKDCDAVMMDGIYLHLPHFLRKGSGAEVSIRPTVGVAGAKMGCDNN